MSVIDFQTENESDIIKIHEGPFKFLKPNVATVAELDPSTDYWFSGQAIPLRDPLVVKYGEYKERVELLNYAMFTVKADVCFEYPLMAEGKHKIFSVTIEPLQHIIIDTGINDQDNETKLFVEVEDERYKKLQSMNICWNVTIPMTATYGATKRQTRDDVKNILMSVTNLAYTMQSEELKTALRNFEKIYGKKFRLLPEYKDDTGAGLDNYQNYPTNTPEEVMCLDLTKEEDMKRLMTVFGVGSDYYGGPQRRNTFSIGVVPNSTAKGKGVTSCVWLGSFYTTLGEGSAIKLREQYIKPTQSYVTSNVMIHEVGHVLGFWHYNSMCYGELIDHGGRVIESIIHLLREELPYWDELAPATKPRCGGNDFERYIVNNPDFIPKFHEKLMAEREARNAEFARFNRSKSNTGIWIIDASANQNLVKTLHPVDQCTYDITQNINCFKAL